MSPNTLRYKEAHDINHVSVQELASGDVYVPHEMVEVEGAGVVPAPYAETVGASLVHPIEASQEVMDHERNLTSKVAEAALASA